jgi:hypothetical protein
MVLLLLGASECFVVFVVGDGTICSGTHDTGALVRSQHPSEIT